MEKTSVGNSLINLPFLGARLRQCITGEIVDEQAHYLQSETLQKLKILHLGDLSISPSPAASEWRGVP